MCLNELNHGSRFVAIWTPHSRPVVSVALRLSGESRLGTAWVDKHKPLHAHPPPPHTHTHTYHSHHDGCACPKPIQGSSLSRQAHRLPAAAHVPVQLMLSTALHCCLLLLWRLLALLICHAYSLTCCAMLCCDALCCAKLQAAVTAQAVLCCWFLSQDAATPHVVTDSASAVATAASLPRQLLA